MRRFPLSHTPEEYAVLYTIAFAASLPYFDGWLPGKGWGRLSAWLSYRDKHDYLPAMALKDLADRTDNALKALFASHDQLFTDEPSSPYCRAWTKIARSVLKNDRYLLAADMAGFHPALMPRRPPK